MSPGDVISLIKDGSLDSVFKGGAWLGPPKGPDTSQCDSGACQWMEEWVEAEFAETPAEIRAAVRKCWKRITPAMAVGGCRKIRRNLP